MKKESLLQERRDFFSKMFITGTGSLALLSLSGCNSSDSITEITQLTEDQKDDLFYIYQEEKLARDVYITFSGDDMYPEANTFAYIQLSEQRHIDSVKQLCIKYGVDISEVNEDVVGEFVLPELQDLYDTLIALGTSLSAALQVGIDIEILDITDLDERAVGMPSDVVRVFGNLKEGSQNHLEAFTYALSQVT